MAVLFAGTELEAFVRSDTSTIEMNNGYDSAYVRSGIRIGYATSGGDALTKYMDTASFAATSNFWIHFECYATSDNWGSGRKILECYNASGTALFRVVGNAASSLRGEYWDGSAWTVVGTAGSVPANARNTYDIQVKGGSSGTFKCYVNTGASPAASGDASMTLVADITKIRFWNSVSEGAYACYLSQVIVADEPTLFYKLMSRPPAADGANTAWLGGYGDVSEYTVDDNAYISSSTADEVETFTHSSMSLSGTVKAVVATARATYVSGGPTKMQACIRKSGTNYFGSTITLSTGFEPYVAVFNTDPATSTTWTLTDAAATSTEFGFKSIT